MAAPKKAGLDYFSCDVDIFEDPKLRVPRQKYGYLSGFVYIALLCIMYKDKGYYIDYRSENDKANVIWLVGEKTRGSIAASPKTIEHVIDCLAENELFDGGLFQIGIITSKRAQRNYYSATVDRKACFVNFDYWVLSENDMKNLSTRSVIVQDFINRPNNGSKSTDLSVKQSKAEQSKVKYSKAEQSMAAAENAINDVEKIIGCVIERNLKLEIAEILDEGMEVAVVLSIAHKTMNMNPKNKPAYFRTVLQSYERDGILTEADIQANENKTVKRTKEVDYTSLNAPIDAEWLDRVKRFRDEKGK